MDRIYEKGAIQTAPQIPTVPSIGYPVSGNPATGTPATKPGVWWYHMVIEELLAVITAAGVTPDGATLSQLATAIQSGKLTSAICGGTVNALTADYPVPVKTLKDQMVLAVRVPGPNTQAAVTFTPSTSATNPIAAAPVVKGANQALAVGDLCGDHLLLWNAAYGKWVLLNPATGSKALKIIRQVITTSGTYTPSAGLVFVDVEVQAPGGGAGGVATTSAGAGGGGAGAYARGLFSASVIGASQVVTIGASGVGGNSSGTSGTAGGTTSFGALISCPGGNPGLGATSTNQSKLGGAVTTVPTGGLINIPGEAGFRGLGSSNGAISAGGHGGRAQLGPGGQDGDTANGGTPAGFGGGGGAGANGAYAGGNGAPAVVVVTEYCYQ